ncbi:MAG: GntR family transcriptional regulator [Chloroflexi bacterium]|jgi:GntR family transcriptional regulator|nr:GntR family transcriptional regulator [Chloroflexota bacterium]MBT3670670.1 GntR family transcriptional regulator [Chloroflexota bacterium]MBT4002671.1 GntR family transcriptional regulator [Chloroflexota bacterium]MBT4306294.1 GntR family transcriptional regulator [Chloroflexota bacterium]MBT4532825.1 GntR family transcriptional regulator [Chloroflexota bacterium]
MSEKNQRPTSLSQNLHDRLNQVISETEPGSRLPSEPRLAKKMGVSRATLREAMRTFETQGVIHRRQGVGTFVIHPSQVIETGLETLESIHTVADRINLDVQMSTFRVEHRLPTEKEQKILSVKPNQKVNQTSWVMEAEGRPVAYLVDIMPDDLISPEDIRRQFTGSILDILLRRKDISLTTSRSEINAVAAQSDVAKALGVQKRAVLLYFEAQLFTAQGRLIDYSYSYYLPGYFRFHVLRRVGQGS